MRSPLLIYARVPILQQLLIGIQEASSWYVLILGFSEFQSRQPH